MSGASRLSKGGQPRPASQYGGSQRGKFDDGASYASSKKLGTEAYSEINEDDEWTAILKFNTLLHYEE